MALDSSLRDLLKYSALAVFLIPVSSALADEKLELTHTVYLGGLYLGSVNTHINQTDNNYQIESTAKTNGTWEWLFSWAAEGQSQGAINNKALIPEMHVHKSAWNDRKRGAFIQYSQSGQVTYEIIGKPYSNLKKYTPLDPDSVHNSLDPMSAMLAASERLEKGEGCNGTYPIFDGRRRYNVMLSDVPVQEFGPSDYSVFEGNAAGCKIEIAKLGGFKRNSDYDLPEDSELVLWAGSPAEGGPVVPVRMQMMTNFGQMELHLSRYSQGATKLASKIVP